MICNSLDLTLEGALVDPMVAAVMRADRVDPRRFEALLRSAAREIATPAGPKQPWFSALAAKACSAVEGTRLFC